MAVKLRLPAVAATLDPELETRPVFIEEWTESLPYADPGAVLEQLLAAVSRLNRNPLKPAARFAALERYLRSYAAVLTLMHEQRAVHTIAAFERRRFDVDRARRVATELAYGYKLVLADGMGRRWRRGALLGPALQRAGLGLTHVLLHAYHQYLPPPLDVWPELGELFGFARREGLAAAAAPAARLDPGSGEPFERHYKAILVTSLLDPYRFELGEVWRVFHFVRARADAIALETPRPTERSAGVFHVDPDAEQRPLPVAWLPEPPAGGWLLNTRPMLVGLQRELDGPAATPAGGEQALARRVLEVLGRPPRRRGERGGTVGEVRVATGLPAVHAVLSGASTAPGPTADETHIVLAEDGGSAPLGPSRHVPETWEVANRSPGGLALAREARPGALVRAGALVAVAPPSGEPGGWILGAVRWLHVAPSGRYHAGVELFIGPPSPARVRALGHGEPLAPDDADGWPALVLERSATLVTRAGVYAPGRALALETGGATTPVRCAEPIERLAGWERIAWTSDP